MNLKIVGDDKVEEMQQSLTASKKAAISLAKQTRNFGAEMSLATDQASAQVVIDNERIRVQTAILDISDDISKLDKRINDDLVKTVQLEQSKLDLLPEGSSGYKAQEDALEAAKDSLKQANSQMATLNGQLVSANVYHDEFLVSQEAMVANFAKGAGAAQSMADYQNDLKDNITKVTRSSAEALRVNKQLREELDQYNDSMKNFMKNYGGMVDDVMNGFDSIGDSITGTLDKIPLIGGLLSKYASGPLGEAADIAKNAFGGALKESFKIMDAGGSATEAIAGGMGSFVNGLSGLGSALSKLLSGPFILITAIAGLLFLAFQRFGELEGAARDFRKEVGGTLDVVRPIVDEVRRVNVEFAHMGVTLEGGFRAASALTEKFGTFGLKVMPGAIETVALLSEGLGVTDANAAGAMEKFRMMGVAAGDAANNMTMAVASAANLAGVNADEVMADIANASEDALAFMGQAPGALAAAAVKARQLGTSLNDVAGTMESMVDFESSMNKEMALSTMLGSHISMDRLRQLSFAGDAEGVMKEQSRLLKEMGGLENMNFLQRKAAAEALGTSVENLMKMEQSEKDQAAFRAKYGDEAIALEKELEALRGGETQDAADRMKQQLKEQVQQEKMNQLKNKFNEMMIDLSEKLLPAVEVAMEMLVPILSFIFKLVGWILYPFELIGMAIDYIREAMQPVVDWIDKMAKSLGFVSDAGDIVGRVIGSIVLGIIVWAKVIKPLMEAFKKGLGGIFKSVTDWVKDGAKKIGDAIGSVSKGVKTALGSVGKGIGDLVKGISGGIQALADGIGKGIKALFEGIAKGLQSLTGFLRDLLTAIGDGIAGLADGVGRALSSLGKAVADVVTSIGQGVAGLAKGLGDAIASLAQGIGEGIASILQGVGEGVESLIKSLSNLSVKDMLKAAVGLLALAGALWITAKALQEFESVSWDSVLKGTLVLGALTAAAVALGNVGGQILKGAFAVAVLGASLIPAAYAFGLLADVSWGAVWGAIGAISVLAIVAGILGAPPIIGFVLMGAVAIGALGLAMIPFAVAALIAGYAAGLVADAFVKMAGALSELTLEQVGVIFALGVSFAFLGGLLPLIIMGAISLGVIAVALSAFGLVADLVAPGIELLATGFDRMVESLSKITLENVATLALLGATVIGLGVMIVPMMLGAAAIGVMSVALGALGLAAIVAAPALGFLATTMSMLGESLTHITLESVLTLGLLGITILGFAALAIPAVIAGVVMVGLAGAITVLGGAAMIAAPALAELSVSLNPMIDKMVAISEVAGDLMFAAAAIGAVGFALAGLGIGGAVGEVASSVGSFIGGAIGKVGSLLGFNEDPAEKEDPLDKMIRLGKHGKDLQAAADAITRLSDLSGLSSDVGYALGDIADGISGIAWTMLWANDIFSESEGMENLTNMLNTFAAMSTNAEGLIAAASGISAIGEALSSLASGRLENSIADVADGVTGFFGSLFGGGDKQEVEKLDPMEQFIRIGEVGPDIEKAANSLIKLSEVQFDGSGISSLAAGLMKFGDAMRAMTSDDSGGGVGGFFSRLFGRKEKKKESPLDKLMTSLSAFADVTKAMGPGAETMASILTGLGTIASESFVTGMAKATDSIYAFVAALSTIPDHKAEVFAEVATAAISGSEARAVEQTNLGGAGVPIEEMSGLGEGQVGTAAVTETLATVSTHPNAAGAGGTPATDMSTTEANLAELIGLMKSGGIAVYLDSKKVSKALAAAAEE